MTAFKPNPLNYILGLDIGIASVGWAMVEIDDKENPVRLIDLGVRVFERAEVPKTEIRWQRQGVQHAAFAA